MIETKERPTGVINEQMRACVQALDDKKADNLKVLDLRGKSTLTDYFIIATGTSEPHLRAMSSELEKVLDALQVETIRSGTSGRTGWVVVDAYDFIVHLFTAEVRAFYNLEGLWKDADLLDPAGI
jgi:ribosome-associated protein